MLEGKQLVQKYDGIDILRDVTIQVPAAATTALIGKSGSGKSTLLRTLSLVDRPVAGTISMFGETVFPAASRVSDVGIAPWPDITLVFQQFFLWPHLSIRENIVLPARLRRGQLDDVVELSEKLGIIGLLDRRPNMISVGQRQRVALARALLTKPKFLLLDEITSAQDVQHISQILDVLKTAVSCGLGLLVVSHHLGFVRNLLSGSPAARVVFLDAGIIAECGPANRLESPMSAQFQEYVKLSLSLR